MPRTSPRPVSPNAQRLREERREVTRARILTACLEMFDEKGYGASSVEELAERAGCSKVTVYSYYPAGLDMVLRDLYQRMSDEFNTQLDEAVGHLGDDAADIIATAVRLSADYGRRPVTGRFFQVEGAALVSVLGEAKGTTTRHVAAIIEKSLRAATGSGRISSHTDVETISRIAIGLIREAGALSALGSGEPERLESATRDLLNGLLRGNDRRA